MALTYMKTDRKNETVTVPVELISGMMRILDSLTPCGVSYPQTALLDNDIGMSNSFACFQPNGGEHMPSRFKERVKVGADADGNSIYQWAHGSTKDALHTAIANLIGAQSSVESPTGDSTPLWDKYAWDWFETYQKPKLTPKAATAQENRLKVHVAPAFAGKRINAISTKDVQTILNGKANYGQSYVRDIMLMMKQVFNSALEDELIAKNPMNSKKVFNPSKKKPASGKALSKEAQADIIANIPKLKAVEDRRLMAFLMFTAMRPCEIFGLRWEDIDVTEGLINIQRDGTFTKGKLIIGDTKTEKSTRSIPFDNRLREYLEPMETEGFIIVRTQCRKESDIGTPYTEQAASSQWQRIKRTIDVHGMTPYVGRHTYATNMSRAGVALKVAADIMGHTDGRMLNKHYIHPDMADLKQATQAVAALTAVS